MNVVTKIYRACMGRLYGALPRRFVRDKRGVTAIEFGILAFPFMLMIFAILESSISFGASQVLTNATDDLARQFRTGQIKTTNKDDLKKRICDRIKIMVDNNCTGLVVDLQNFTTFAQAAAVKVKFTSSGDLDETGFDAKLGPARSINMLRVFYKWPVITDFMRRNLKDGKTLQFAVSVWQNEPFNN